MARSPEELDVLVRQLQGFIANSQIGFGNDAVDRTTTATTPASLAGERVTVPFDGDYEVSFGGRASSSAAAQNLQLGVDHGTDEISEGFDAANVWQWFSRVTRIDGLTAGTTIGLTGYVNPGPATMHLLNGYIYLRLVGA